jgi:hypothetical protein
MRAIGEGLNFVEERCVGAGKLQELNANCLFIGADEDGIESVLAVDMAVLVEDNGQWKGLKGGSVPCNSRCNATGNYDII